MPVTVYIPTPFRRATGNRDHVEVTAGDVGGLLDEIESTYEGLRGLVRNDEGEVHHHVNIYVNSEPIEGLVTIVYECRCEWHPILPQPHSHQALFGPTD